MGRSTASNLLAELHTENEHSALVLAQGNPKCPETKRPGRRPKETLTDPVRSREDDTVKVAKFVETSVLPVLKSARANASTIEAATSLASP
jgi:hypothetical protein